MFKEKIKVISVVLCISLFAFMLTACGGKKSSKGGDAESSLTDESFVSSDGSFDESEESASDDVEDDADDTSAESAESSEDFESDDVSDGVSEDYSDDVSEDISEEYSEDVSHNVSGDTSTDVSGDEIDYELEEFAEKYGELDFVKAISNLSTKYPDTMKMSLKAKVDAGKGQTVKINMDYFMDARGSEMKVLLDIKETILDKPILSMKMLSVGSEAYLIDDASKQYCAVPYEELGANPVFNFSFKDIQKVVTKNEIVNGDIYVADWIYVSGGKVGYYTKDGELKYMAVVSEGSSKSSAVFEFDFSDDISGVSFEVPKGYELVDPDFQLPAI